MKRVFQQKNCANNLRLQANSLDDLKVLSTFLQDFIVQVADILYIPSQKRVIMVLKRFRWEIIKTAETIGKQIGFQRCLCGLMIEKVKYMQTQRIDMKDRSKFLNLLIFFESDQRLDLQFSDSKTIRLGVDTLKLTAKDIGESWPTTLLPKHEETS
ncbi:MAG: DUF2948 family protein [Pseudomonadota bacterium]|nr:DUF2948 family protein [Pseudomonadota bacterium]